jgi:alpha-2-macroglobulin
MLMRPFFLQLTVLLLINIHSSNAQDLIGSRKSSYYTFIYRITGEQAHRLYKNAWTLKKTDLTNLHDFFPTDSLYNKVLPLGHYVFVQAVGGHLKSEIHSVNNLSLTLLNNHRDLLIILSDSTGKEVTSADTRINWKLVPFDRETKSYRIGKSNNHGIFTVRHQGHTSYFEIERQRNNGFVVRSGRKILGSFPISHLISPVLYIKNNIKNVIQGGTPYAPGFLYRAKRLIGQRPYSGYIVFNKPKYKQGDTVRIKSFVSTQRGKPLRKTVTINLQGYQQRYFSKKLATIKPFRPGGYKHEFVLSDTLKMQLDSDYNVEIVSKRGRRLLFENFRFEEYELKNNSYTVRGEKNNDKTTLYLKATNSNDMTLFDIRAEVLLVPENIERYYDQNIFIKDTLWRYETKLEPIGETRVAIPDSVIPNVLLDCKAIVSFLSSEKERVVKEWKFSFDKAELPVLISVKNDSLLIDSKDGLRTVRLKAYQKDNVVEKTITLPYREKLNYFVNTYRATSERKEKSVFINALNDNFSIQATRTTDSIFIVAENPRKLVFRYFLFRNQHLIDKGQNTDLKIRKRTNTTDSYSLSVQYIWGGESQSKEYEIPFNKKSLDIKIDHSPVVYPGEDASFTITVKDAFGAPVENVDLTAYALTKKFSSQHSVSVPDFSKPRKSRIIFNEFTSKRINTETSMLLEYAYWRKTLGLDSITFYQFLYPDRGYFEHRYPAGTSQVAPFVIGHEIETVGVVYIDDQVVYYNGVSTIEPYSFAVSPGKHKIQLRLRNALITLNDVRIDSAQKLIFSIDKFHLPAKSTLTTMPSNLTDGELTKLARHFIEVPANRKYRDAYLRQQERYHLFNRNTWNYYWESNLVGPLYPGNVTYAERDGQSITFDYEPFQRYEFEQGIVKMRQANIRNALMTKLKWYSDPPSFKDAALTDSTIREYWNSDSDLRTFQRFPDNRRHSKGLEGKLTLEYRGKSVDALFTKATFLVNLDHPTEYCVVPHVPTNELFHKGTYQAIVLLHDGTYLKADSLVVQPSGTNYYNLMTYPVQKTDSISVSIFRLIRKWSQSANFGQRERELELERLRQLYIQQSSTEVRFTRRITGNVTDAEGLAIPGVNVVVKGTVSGTTTDLNGNYSIFCPYQGQLVFFFIGYQSVEVPIENNATINTVLHEDISQLSDVVVVGYGESRKERFLTGALSGRVAGITPGQPITTYQPIRIRGVSGNSLGATPLVILDGRVVELSDVDRNRITAMELVDSSAAVSLYGARASNGVLLISTKAGATSESLKQMSSILLTTGEEVPGNLLRKNFRDYAFWKPDLTTDKNGKASFRARFPDDITGWNTHVLGTSNRKQTGQISTVIQSYKPLLAQIAQPNFLIEGDKADALGKITNYTDKTIHLQRRITVGGMTISEDTLSTASSRLDTIPINPSDTDSVTVEYQVQFNKYKDGELRKIPVYRKGTLETKGIFVPMERDTTFTIDLPQNGNRVKIFAQADLIDVLLEESLYLRGYTYECNEQLASKLRGLLAEKAIAAFRNDKFNDSHGIQRTIRKLAATQNPDGSWGWWKDQPGEVWITLHVARVLFMAEKQGYSSATDKDLMTNFLLSKLSSLSTGFRLEALTFLAEQGMILKVNSFADSIRSSEKSTLREKLMAERLWQTLGNKVNWKWINSMRSQTIKGNYYWGGERPQLHDNSISNTLIVYQMASREKTKSIDLRRIENYFLEQRKAHWRNTFESSLIVETLLPEMLNREQSNGKTSLRISGAVEKSTESFPFELSLDGGRIDVTKTGGSPVYFTAYTEEWNSTPSREDKDFAIKTYFEQSGNTLVAGTPAILNIEVEVKKDAEYVMVEVPIPAGCSYDSKEQPRRNGEVHREYFLHKTNIYCKYLTRGTYRYKIALLPRYNGTYTLNPAVVECMYFPTLSGRDGIKNVVIQGN